MVDVGCVVWDSFDVSVVESMEYELFIGSEVVVLEGFEDEASLIDESGTGI